MQTFEIKDTARSIPALHPHLRCDAAFPHIPDIYKILIGRADILDKSTRKKHKCRFDFALERSTNGVIGSSALITRIVGEPSATVDFISDFEKISKNNIGFYKALCSELTHCIANLQSGSFVESYMHLYRTIEKIAISFPLIYLSSIQDFQRTQSALSEIFDKDSGELKFTKVFSEILSTRAPYLESYEISFYTEYEEVRDFVTLTRELKFCFPNIINSETEIDENEGYFSLAFIDVPSFLISVRNRLFHNSNSGQINLNVDKIGGAGELCRMCVYAGLHWVTLVFGEVIRERATRISG